MKRVKLWSAALAGLAGVLACTSSHGEIYGWVDDSGHVTYSNLAPPKSARVFDQIEETPIDPAALAQSQAAAREAQLQALNERVQQLERQLKQGQQAPAPVSYAPPPSMAAAAGCDPQVYDCLAWDSPIYYSIGLPARWPSYRHGEFHGRGSRHFAQNSFGPTMRPGAKVHR